MEKNELKRQIEKLNKKIGICLDEFKMIIEKMNNQKDDPQMIIFHNYSRQLSQVEIELSALTAERNAYQLMLKISK